MKVRLKYGKQELIILAITWSSGRSKSKAINRMGTQFSGYDGNGLQELIPDEFDILDPSIDNFVYTHQDDDRFCGLVWQPLAQLEFWQLVQDYDPQAITELQALVRAAPELS